jgi:hypothetical protein
MHCKKENSIFLIFGDGYIYIYINSKLVFGKQCAACI